MQTTGQVLNLNTQAIARLETQLGQLATVVSERKKGKFPSQPVTNPKDNGSSSTHPAHVNAVHTLRSGKQIDNQVRIPPDQTLLPSNTLLPMKQFLLMTKTLNMRLSLI